MPPDQEMTVINEEYDRILTNPDGVIVSESLMGLLPDSLFSEETAESADNHQLFVTARDDEENEFSATANGTLHTISSGSDMSVAIIIRGDYHVLLQVLHDASTSKMPLETIQLIGSNGFTSSGTEILGWSLTKIKSYDFLLTINFRGSDVVFR
jgi:hypothetical protein